jgi:hypothetical protein
MEIWEGSGDGFESRNDPASGGSSRVRLSLPLSISFSDYYKTLKPYKPKNRPRKGSLHPVPRQLFSEEHESFFATASDFLASTFKYVLPESVREQHRTGTQMFTCQFPAGEMRLYHGVSRRRYEQMLMNCGWNRELSSNPSDFVSDETALYFTNDPAYALFWSTVKSCGFSRVDHRLDELQGIVIEVQMNTASWMGGVTVIPRRITDDFIEANWSTRVPSSPKLKQK